MIAEGPESVVVLSVNIIGDRPTCRDELGSRTHGQHPAPWYHHSLDVAQEHTGFAPEQPGFLVKRYEAVQISRRPQAASRIQANVPVAPTHSVGNPRLMIANGRERPTPA